MQLHRILRQPGRRFHYGSARNFGRQWRHKLSRMRGRPTLRELAKTPDLAVGGVTSARVNALLERNRGNDYLEVGVANGETLEAVRAGRRAGVDPCPVFALDRLPTGVSFNSVMSDLYFGDLAPSVTFDAVLLDGLHEFNQTYRDLNHSLAHLRPGGFILIDDTVPADAVAALPSQAEAIRQSISSGLSFPRPWMGDVYRVVYALSAMHPDLDYYTYVGSGRHQTVVWRGVGRGAQATPRPWDESVLSLDFDESWLDELPQWFHAANDDEILQAFERSTAP